MAANTAVVASFQARDWETIIGIMDYTPTNDYRKMVADLTAYYNANGKPQGNTLIPITTKEKTLLTIFEKMYGQSVRNVMKDTTASAFSRVVAAIRLLNNPIDNYINQQLVLLDTAIDTNVTTIKKYGREVILNEGYDNN